MAKTAERIGVAKTQLEPTRLLTLAVLAGAFIAFGALASSIALAGADGAMPYGIARLIAGIAFSVGLILVVVGGAELFTGNNLMVMAWAGGEIRLRDLARAWTIVYVGNFAGAAATAALVFATGAHEAGNGAVGAAALATARAKAELPFLAALANGVLGNVLVCLAVWLCYSARTTADRILAIVPPVTIFVAAGFEHSVANMFILPHAILVKDWAPAAFWTAIGEDRASFAALDAMALLSNLVPVTLGNLIGGGVLVGAVYWFVYLRRR
jgi:formate/nitrite transporter